MTHLSSIIARMPEATCFEMNQDGNSPTVNLHRCILTFSYLDALGWLEHTGDWDWWIRVGFKHGAEVFFDCGSTFHSVVVEGEHGRKEYTDDAILSIIHSNVFPIIQFTIRSFVPFDYDRGLEEERLTHITLADVDHIVIGYDT